MSKDPYADFKDTKTLTEGVFADLNELIEIMGKRELDLIEAEEALTKAKDALRLVEEVQIPEQLDLMGMKEFTDTEGRKIKIVTKIRASVLAANKPAMFMWLEDQGHGGMIKSTITVAFNREQKKEAQELAEKLRGEFAGVQQLMKVEPATLTAFVKGQLEAGDEIPLHLITVFEQRIAKITQPKK